VLGTAHEETNNYYHVETLPKTCYLLLALNTYDTKEQDSTMVERERQLILSLHVWRKTLRGGMPAMLPPQQSQLQLESAKTLGIETSALKLVLYIVSLPTKSCLVSNTTVRCRQEQQPCLGLPRMRWRFCAYIQESVKL
jgi:hypothetical protein